MTTNFFDKFCTFKCLLSWRLPRKKKKKQCFGRFPLCSQGHPPSKSENFIIIVVSPALTEIPRRGRSREGRCANLSQSARQICAKLPLFRFVHQRKGVQNCRKFVVNLKVY